MPNFLSPEFLSPYEFQTPRNAGILFQVVYLRTYSRFLEDKGRRERWYETVARVVQYSLELYEGPASHDELVAEAELMYDKIFHLEVLPAGRTLWVGGTESAKKFGESQFNCSAVVMDELENFGDLFQLLLCGCGVGFRVLREDVKKLPEFCAEVSVENLPYVTTYPNSEEGTTCNSAWGDVGWAGDKHLGVSIRIGDSREGWVEALRLFLKYSVKTSEVSKVTFDFNYNPIRPEGSRIKSFGGRAPGPHGLMEMFTNLAKVLTSAGGRLSPLNVMDINNYIAKNVIVGGTRRSSQIALGSPDDNEFIEAKKGLWVTKENLQRTMSNNSVTFEEDPTVEQIQAIFNGIKGNGEPGFYNLKGARKRRPNAEAGNPCNEVILSSKGFCNLTTINLLAFVEEPVLFESGPTFNLAKAREAIKLATRIGLRMTNITVSLPKWDKVQKRDRLLGVSMTGIMDTFDALGVEFDHRVAIKIVRELRAAANEEASLYAHEMRVPRPLLVTSIKPEGTLTLLTNACSPGLHRAYAPFYIRRIRVSSMDPVAQALIKLGVPNERDQGKNERIVFSFPMESKSTTSADEEPARRQLERYLLLMGEYVDHNASCTLTVGEEEWEEIEKMIFDNFHNIIGCAFLPKGTTSYPQMPYEAITREQYLNMVEFFPANLMNQLPEIVDRIERGEYNEVEPIEDECKGACPIR